MTNAAATGLPFDDIRALLRSLPEPQEHAAAHAAERNRQLIKPEGSLGRLEEINAWLASWQTGGAPAVTRPMVALFATSHGVALRDGAAPRIEATRRMMEALAAGGAAVNQLCVAHELGLKIFDLAIDHPTPDISSAEALPEADCAATMAFGMEAIAGGTDLLILGDLAIGNGIVAAAICLALYGGAAEDWLCAAPGDDAASLGRKASLVREAVAFHAGHLSDPLEVLRRLGGREVMAIAGAILAARHQYIPVLLDGHVVCAAAAVLHAINPAVLDHCLAAHRSPDAAHGRLLEKLAKAPLLDLGIKLGEGTGAALAVGLVKAAVQCHSGMATHEQAAVTAG
ncbi:nicotinate-nucleotide--dimethylbenzimidazole phosphoribosyltransferase [Agaricicola taiwanensis]|nr:nicotinate-nucleotide--dimethylbenzimidazole phosphoribosyltransferase [Agaricicola taiwanensis]